MNSQNQKLAFLLSAVVGGIFLFAGLRPVFNGAPLTLSPALATGIGILLGATISFFVRRGRSGPPGPPNP